MWITTGHHYQGDPYHHLPRWEERLVGKGSKRRPGDDEAYKANHSRIFNRDKLYGRRWRRLRANYLAENPLCVMCEAEGKVQPATELDHIVRHKGNPRLFFDNKNWQGLCAYHHRSVKAQMERSGRVKGNNATGEPIDPNHHWNR